MHYIIICNHDKVDFVNTVVKYKLIYTKNHQKKKKKKKNKTKRKQNENIETKKTQKETKQNCSYIYQSAEALL